MWQTSKHMSELHDEGGDNLALLLTEIGKLQIYDSSSYGCELSSDMGSKF